ncbi:hypothetical protein GCM10022258_08230 [Aquimarina gracilis]
MFNRYGIPILGLDDVTKKSNVMINQTLDESLLKMAEVQNKHEDELLGLSNVVGVALGNKVKEGVETEEPVLSVLVTHKLDKSLLSRKDMVNKTIEGIKTDVVEVGEVFAGNALAELQRAETDMEVDTHAGGFSPMLNNRIRPAKGGYSVGHYKISAGTIGTCCYDLGPFPSRPRNYYILSNNHVLANSNNARIGDPILQPGPYDGGKYPRDVIARLSRFIPIKFINGNNAPCNYVDAAIAEGNLKDLNREIYWGGHVKRLYAAPKVGDIVQKTGRTTGFTTGRVTNINATVNVNFGGGKIAKFCRQIITTNMSAGGDSGSLVTDRNEGAVGLLFAGSSTRTIINNILYVQSLLKVRVTEI